MSNDPNPFVTGNPYASPVTASLVTAPGNQLQGGVWRQGNILVMHKRAGLPNRCVKTNEPTEYKLKRSLSWHHPLVFLAILLNLLIYIIIALAIRKTAVIHVGLSKGEAKKRIRNMVIAWSLVLAGFLSLITAAVFSSPSSSDLVVVGFISSPILIFFGAIWGLYRCRIVYPKKIDEEFVYLKGVCPAYLAQFPEC